MSRRLFWVIAAISSTLALAQHSFAQDSICSMEYQDEYVNCSHGTGCVGTVFTAVPANEGYGYWWNPTKQMCSIGTGCYVWVYNTDYDYCIGSQLRSQKTLDQLAQLALTRSVLIADCQGHYRQYRRTVSVHATRRMWREPLQAE